ncbi:hypothetical protein SESBI_42322 [Sesbania bispinosa]|nr:hypothetical protein SESBI_42322 [Sesbania bispinosa]
MKGGNQKRAERKTAAEKSRTIMHLGLTEKVHSAAAFRRESSATAEGRGGCSSSSFPIGSSSNAGEVGQDPSSVELGTPILERERV